MPTKSEISLQMSLGRLHALKIKVTQVHHKVYETAEMKAKLWERRDLSKVIGAYETQLEGRGRVLIRVSGTEPVIRVMVEGEDQHEIAEIADNIGKAIEKYLPQ